MVAAAPPPPPPLPKRRFFWQPKPRPVPIPPKSEMPLPEEVAAMAAAVVAILVSVFVRTKRRQRLPAMAPPKGPSFGEFVAAARDGTSIEAQASWAKQYGGIYAIKKDLACVGDPKVAKELVLTHAKMGSFTTRTAVGAAATRDAVGRSVTGLVGNEWRWRKDAILREFHSSRLLADERRLFERIVRAGETMCARLEAAAEAETPACVDLLTTEAAVSVILFAFFGRDLPFDPAALRHAAKTTMDFFLYRLGHSRLSLFLASEGRQLLRAKRDAWKAMDAVLRPEVELMLKEKEGTRHPDRHPGSVLESLLKLPEFCRSGLDSIVAEARVFVLAGFETTAHALSFSLGLLARDRDLAAKVSQQAIDACATGLDRASLAATPFVKHVFMEALRLYPLVPALGGQVTNSCVVTDKRGTAFGLAKGTQIIFHNLVLQRDPDFAGASPDLCVPDRWDVPIKNQPFLFTFNLGPHACPGKSLSLIEAHVFLLQVAAKFDLSFDASSSPKELAYQGNAILRPKDGMPLFVKNKDADDSAYFFGVF
ncbi:hypothetical protein CTAYLR_002687 [Chrysophaeum taylorii]|uniref:Cytochrome P450 n=1 Tax=Chrysophaeum taylorii TaxID=2483200 RepID=A0AAD7XHN9_9STRA|nr:hypothetical protein CTAYLR_002687 [Chrysophaeum taylorii]